MNRFGELLREARKQARLTQQALADKVGVDDSYISKMEIGVFEPPSREVALKLTDALGLSNEGDRKRIEFLFAAGVVSDEDLRGFALVKWPEQAPQKTSAPSTVFHSPLFISSQEVLVHRLAVLKKRLELAEKNLQDANEELRELHVLVDEMFNKE